MAQYYHNVKQRGLDFILDLFDPYYICPICGGRDCAQFLGYYPRPVYDEKGTFYKSFLIVRFECHRKGSNVLVQHRTFSLLPYQLIPYCKYSIPFVIKVLNMIHIEDKSTMQVQELLSKYDNSEEYVDLAQSSIFKFKNIIISSMNKLLSIIDSYQEFKEKNLLYDSDKKRIAAFLIFARSFVCFKTNPQIRGPCALGYDFFLIGGGYIKNNHFLFGTPSQFRNI